MLQGLFRTSCCQIPSYKAILPRMTYWIQVSLAQVLFGFVKSIVCFTDPENNSPSGLRESCCLFSVLVAGVGSGTSLHLSVR
jgi:hypothetical protein